MSDFEYNPNPKSKKLGINVDNPELETGIDMVSSPYVDLNPDVNLNATRLEDLDDFEDNQNEIINQDNIYVDPISKPLFLAPARIKKQSEGKITKQEPLNMTISEFFKDISNSYINILDDLLSNNYNDLTDLLLKNNRGLAFGVLLIIIALFFVFFSPFD